MGRARLLGRRWSATAAWVHNFYEDKDIESVNYLPNIRPIGEAVMYELALDVSYSF